MGHPTLTVSSESGETYPRPGPKLNRSGDQKSPLRSSLGAQPAWMVRFTGSKVMRCPAQ